MLNDEHFKQGVIVGQKYAYATASLLLGIICFINLLGMERAILAIVFAILALKSVPQPRLERRRLWAIAGLILGIFLDELQNRNQNTSLDLWDLCAHTVMVECELSL
ncbi:MAG: DUF4190 domain-containing protein [Sedimentisphaerales bacterium]